MTRHGTLEDLDRAAELAFQAEQAAKRPQPRAAVPAPAAPAPMPAKDRTVIKIRCGRRGCGGEASLGRHRGAGRGEFRCAKCGVTTVSFRPEVKAAMAADGRPIVRQADEIYRAEQRLVGQVRKEMGIRPPRQFIR